ncbi:MAG TPA: cupin domain-containing protein [Chitinophagaceae bacterium]|nr:cupin domain-containing protein [Chitinophagaceae bacterium]
MNASYYIDHLALLPHPEGGYYKQTYQSPLIVEPPAGSRPVSTAIFYLLEQGDFSAFHTLKSDECWHFYAGSTLLIHIIEPNGNYYCTSLGNQKDEQLQFIVPAGVWFSAEPAPSTSFALVGCTVAPGFVYEDFAMARMGQLLEMFPQHSGLIRRLCRRG